MTIIRDGKEIELTPEEIRQILSDEHEADVRYEVEQALEAEEEDGIISFDNWAEVSYADYASRDDARNDFIEYITEHILEMEDIDERNPAPYRYVHDYTTEVLDTAEDLGYLKGE